MNSRVATTIGNVPSGHANRYWKFTLESDTPRSVWHRLAAYLFWVCHTLLIVLYSAALLPILKLNSIGRKAKDPMTTAAIANIDDFIDVYPTSLYPLVVKSVELAHYSRQSLPEPSLELGTGDGFFTDHLYCRKPGAKLTLASDLIGHTLVQAKLRGFWRQLAVIDSAHIPLPDNSLSTVIMNNLIHHLPSRTETLKEIHRVLKPGGRFIVTDEYTGWATSQWHIKIWKLLGNMVYQRNLNNFLHKSVQCLLHDTGFWVDDNDWHVVETHNFFSNGAMYNASIMETLNRKLGSPTPKPIRNILTSLPWLAMLQKKLIRGLAITVIASDGYNCRQYGATSVFVVLEKTDQGVPRKKSEVTTELKLVCPICHSGLTAGMDCPVCHKVYPMFDDDIPFMIPYVEKLPARVLADTNGAVVPDVSC